MLSDNACHCSNQISNCASQQFPLRRLPPRRLPAPNADAMLDRPMARNIHDDRIKDDEHARKVRRYKPSTLVLRRSESADATGRTNRGSNSPGN